MTTAPKYVYVVLENFYYEGNDVSGVFLYEDAARNYILDEIKKGGTGIIYSSHTSYDLGHKGYSIHKTELR